MGIWRQLARPMRRFPALLAVMGRCEGPEPKASRGDSCATYLRRSQFGRGDRTFAGARQPEVLSNQLLMLIEWAYSTAGILGKRMR
jgi:hypothetical protein